MAVAISQLGNAEDAIKGYEASCTTNMRDADPVEWALAMRNMASAYQRRADGDKKDNYRISCQLYESALTVLTEKAHPTEFIDGLEFLSKAQLFLGDYRAAAATAQQVLAAVDEQLSIVTEGTDDFGAKDAIRTNVTAAVAVLVKCHTQLGHVARALEVIDERHCRGLADMAHLSNAHTMQAESLGGENYGRWHKAKQATQSLQRQLDTLEKDSHVSNVARQNIRDELAAARSKERDLLHVVKEANPSLLLPEEQLRGMNYGEMQAALGPNTAAAVWYVTEQFAGVFLLSGKLSAPSLWTYTPEQQAEISAAVMRFRFITLFDDGERAFKDAFKALSSALCMRDIHDHLLRQNDQTGPKPAPKHAQVTRASVGNNYQGANHSQLVIVAHGHLHGVPFDALPVRRDGVCLADVYTDGVLYSPNMSVFNAAVGRAPGSLRLSPGGLVAVQNPTENLPAADEEVRQIADLLTRAYPDDGEPCILKNRLADRDSIIRELTARHESDGGAFALHLACHGSYDPVRRWESSLELAGTVCTSFCWSL